MSQILQNLAEREEKPMADAKQSQETLGNLREHLVEDEEERAQFSKEYQDEANENINTLNEQKDRKATNANAEIQNCLDKF